MVHAPVVDDGLVARVRAQRDGCALGASPLYAGLLDDVAADVAAGGPCRAAVAPYASEPEGHAAVLRLLCAVHELALEGAAPALAAHYPSCGGTPGPGVGAAFVATVAEHLDRVRTRTADPIQTNEVGRSAALVGGLLVIARRGLPVRLLEVGASAGLNLRADRYRYEAGDGSAFGPADSPVRFADPWAGGPVPPLDARLDVVERRGCDARPLDPAAPADVLRLRASLWPDQAERRARLDGALEVAAQVPAAVDRADAGEWAAARLADPVEGAVTVLTHSIVAQYLAPVTRRALERALEDAGARATPSAPVAWLRMEPAGPTHAEVRLTLWPAPGRGRAGATVLARSAFHGPPVHWRA